MASKPTMLTAEGHKKLEEELEFLQNVKRKEIAEKIKVSNERVHLTSVVTVEMLETGAQKVFTIVGSGSNETNPREGKISDESPVGAALMDKSVGDVVEVETPGGILPLKILEISK